QVKSFLKKKAFNYAKGAITKGAVYYLGILGVPALAVLGVSLGIGALSIYKTRKGFNSEKKINDDAKKAVADKISEIESKQSELLNAQSALDTSALTPKEFNDFETLDNYIKSQGYAPVDLNGDSYPDCYIDSVTKEKVTDPFNGIVTKDGVNGGPASYEEMKSAWNKSKILGSNFDTKKTIESQLSTLKTNYGELTSLEDSLQTLIDEAVPIDANISDTTNHIIKHSAGAIISLALAGIGGLYSVYSAKKENKKTTGSKFHKLNDAGRNSVYKISNIKIEKILLPEAKYDFDEKLKQINDKNIFLKKNKEELENFKEGKNSEFKFKKEPEEFVEINNYVNPDFFSPYILNEIIAVRDTNNKLNLVNKLINEYSGLESSNSTNFKEKREKLTVALTNLQNLAKSNNFNVNLEDYIIPELFDDKLSTIKKN
ncbi:MAG: hypothetical protein PHN56_03195, partial [Candidatus Nanoarchaeia archaeon]|nr:hypothetical protein [Candidatus Nanoarchaeia archaeon]